MTCSFSFSGSVTAQSSRPGGDVSLGWGGEGSHTVKFNHLTFWVT